MFSLASLFRLWRDWRTTGDAVGNGESFPSGQPDRLENSQFFPVRPRTTGG